jgi:hypothetical protein
MNFQI